ncbi:MAG: alpha-2-macroglobulin family protein [Flavicella sp.]
MKLFLPVAFLLLFFYSCNEKKEVKTENFAFNTYINSTTKGYVSKATTVEVFFNKPIQNVVVGQELSADILELSPKVKGNLYVVSRRKIVFKPDTMLDAATKYVGVLRLDKLFDTPPRPLREYSFNFQTIAPNFTLSIQELQSYDGSYQYLQGTLKSADVVSVSELKNVVKATQNESSLAIKWYGDPSISSANFEFRIDSIIRPENDGVVFVNWDGTSMGIPSNKGMSELTIPGKNNFSVIGVQVHQFPEQHVRINFSDPLRKSQNLRGLVTIEKATKLQYTVDGNTLKVYPKNRITGQVKVAVYTGIKSRGNYKLKKGFSDTITFEALKPSIALLNNGVILPDSKNLQFNFKAVNLKAVDVRVLQLYADNVMQFLQQGNLQNSNSYTLRNVARSVSHKTMPLVTSDLENDGKWKNYAIDLSELIKKDPAAIYRVELSFVKDYSLYKCEGSEGKVDYSIPQKDPNSIAIDAEKEAAYWDGFSGRRPSNYDYSEYNWRDRENPCTPSYFINKQSVGANILATNIGVVVKKGSDNTYFVALTDILTTEPISKADIVFYNYQQQKVATAKSDNQGVAFVETKSKAAFAIASQGAQKTYIRLNEGSALSLSKFNVAGKKIKKGLKGYIYGERGVWRPGDTLHTFFVLDDHSNPLPKAHPIKMEVTDPHGKLHFSEVTSEGLNGFYRFDIPTDSGDATGNWNAKVRVGDISFTKTLKVETIKPNRLKIKLDFEEALLSAYKPIDANIQVNWLHGAPAKNLKTEVKMKLTATDKGFEKYPNYTFKDPIKNFSTEELLIFEGNVDATGKAKIDQKVSVGKSAPGLLKASFLTRVFENGGDFSSDVFSTTLAPFKSFVGMRSPVSKRYGNSYVTDADTTFDLVTLTSEGFPISRKNLEVEVYKIRWYWWWNSSYDNLASYVNKKHSALYKSFKVSTNFKGEAKVNINIPNTNSGRYLIRIKDPVSGHATGRTAYFFKDWWSNSGAKNSDAATMLVFNADKEKYNVGEVAKISFPSSKTGKALLTIENSSQVIQSQWVETQNGQTTVAIPITSEMTPNIFVNISLVQPHASTANDLPLRMYGVIPVLVEDPETRLYPKIEMPEVLEPEKEFKVTVSEKQGKKMTYSLAIVEEGLLDLTRYTTPDLWSEFYKKEALGVRTWDLYDQVIGAFGGTLEQVFAIGGDEDRSENSNKKANRFKPVVKVLGPFTLNKGKKASHKITLPNYIGSVKTMVVAANTQIGAFGKSAKATPVRKPLMVLASLPRKLVPKEKVTLPVTVFAMENKVKDVTVFLKLSKGLRVIGPSKQKIRFAQPDEKMLYFEIEVLPDVGMQTVEVLAKGNGKKASQEIALNVFNPNPIVSKHNDLTIASKGTVTHNFTPFGSTGTNATVVEISTLPPMNFAQRLDYLIQYPHGCVEQTTSSVFPQLFLSSIFDLDSNKKLEIKQNIKKGILRLGKFQLPNGGLPYWMGHSEANDWGTSYAGHFMMEAELKGYALPISFLSNWTRFQKQKARNWQPSRRLNANDLLQAYRLYTLALAGSPDLAAMNRLREYPSLSNESKWRLAAAYALAGQEAAAKNLLATASLNFSKSQANHYSYGSTIRNSAMALETLVLLSDTRVRNVAASIAKKLSSEQWMSTQTTAYCLLSMGKMAQKNGGKSMDVSYEINGKKQDLKTSKSSVIRNLNIAQYRENSFSLENNLDNTLYVRLVHTGLLPVGEELIVQRNLNVFTNYMDSKGETLDVSNLTQGTDFTAVVTISNSNQDPVSDIALSQIFPSGWEIVNTRYTDFGAGAANSADYTDIRDDRVNFYFSLKKNETKTFKVLLNASYLGRYYLPGVQAEAMYDNDYFSRNRGKWISVVN